MVARRCTGACCAMKSLLLFKASVYRIGTSLTASPHACLLGRPSRSRKCGQPVYQGGKSSSVGMGYGRGQCTNKSAGVALYLNNHRFREKNIYQIYSPPDSVQGRGGGVRLPWSVFDIAAFTVYCPPRRTKLDERRVCTETCQILMKWVQSTISKLHRRHSRRPHGPLPF